MPNLLPLTAIAPIAASIKVVKLRKILERFIKKGLIMSRGDIEANLLICLINISKRFVPIAMAADSLGSIIFSY